MSESHATTPDLLGLEPFSGLDHRQLVEVFGLAFLGRELGTSIDAALARASFPDSRWNPALFADDLFLRSLIETNFTLGIEGRIFPVNREFLYRALVHAPTDLATVRFRQQIVRELDATPTLLDSTQTLYRDLFDFMSLLKTPGYQATLDPAAFHLDILKQAKRVIDQMDRSFAAATSGLQRIHDAASVTKATAAYRTLERLLEYESGMARLRLDVTIGGDGRIRRFAIVDLEEAHSNPFHRRPIVRLWERLRLAYRGYPMSNRELMNRIVNDVYAQLSPWLVPLVQLLGHLEFYLTNRSFRSRAEAHGLDVSLADFVEQEQVGFTKIFNPLLLGSREPPVPCDIASNGLEPVVIITGPNSGGKTRLLQAIGVAQVLGQSGLYTPCAEARLRLQGGLFVSLIEEEGARQTEGRLGRELLRIREVFEVMEERSLVILDELCSGTNPSEGVEMFSMVLRLLRQVEPTAFVTTHFLDFARHLVSNPVIPGLEFLQVEVDAELRSTYQFVPGVATTSLAALTAQRLGVTYERLASRIAERSVAPEAHRRDA